MLKNILYLQAGRSATVVELPVFLWLLISVCCLFLVALKRRKFHVITTGTDVRMLAYMRGRSCLLLSVSYDRSARARISPRSVFVGIKAMAAHKNLEESACQSP